MKFRLVIEYTPGYEKVYWFDTYEEAYSFMKNEGDHVSDWGIMSPK